MSNHTKQENMVNTKLASGLSYSQWVKDVLARLEKETKKGKTHG